MSKDKRAWERRAQRMADTGACFHLNCGRRATWKRLDGILHCDKHKDRPMLPTNNDVEYVKLPSLKRKPRTKGSE